MKRIKITWKPFNVSVNASLLEDKNPLLCKFLWDKLPVKGIQDHALISGEYLYGYIPAPELCSLCHYNATIKEPRDQQKIGRINLSVLQHFSIKYGKVTEYLEASPVAQVDASDLKKLRAVGRHVWESTFRNKNLVTFSVTKWPNGNNEGGKNPKLKKFVSEDAEELVKDIDSECSKIWLNPAKEVIDLVEGKTITQVGSFGFYFNSIVFADGLIRALGCMMLGNILRMIDDKKVNVSTIQEIIRNVWSPAFFEFLEYCEFRKLFSFYSRFREIVPSTNNREDLKGLILSLTNYVNRLSGWILHYFPWNLGANLRRD